MYRGNRFNHRTIGDGIAVLLAGGEGEGLRHDGGGAAGVEAVNVNGVCGQRKGEEEVQRKRRVNGAHGN